MAIGISVVGPRKLPYRARTLPPQRSFRFSKLEFETQPGVASAVMVSYGIVLELQLADSVMLVGLARDLIPQKVLAHVNLIAWGDYFEEYSSRDGMRLLFGALSSSVQPLRLRKDAAYLELLETHLEGLPFLLHLPAVVNFEWMLAARMNSTLTYAEALTRLPQLLARFATDPFLYVTDPNPYGERVRAVQ